jgi:hypothetical protein
LQTGQLTQTDPTRVILVRRCLHSDNSDDVRVAMSAGTNSPNRVIVFAGICPLGRWLASEGRRKKRFALALANAMVVESRTRVGREPSQRTTHATTINLIYRPQSSPTFPYNSALHHSPCNRHDDPSTCIITNHDRHINSRNVSSRPRRLED